MSEIIPHWLTKRATLTPNYTAIELPNGQKYTFQDLKMKSQSFARKLSGLGVTKHTKVAILSSNNLNMAVAIHALTYLGAIGILLNKRLADKELQNQLDDAEASLIITPDIERDLSVPSYSFADIWGFTEKNTPLIKEIDLESDFTIIYTSGTTGMPKGVVHTYGNHWWSAIGSMLNLGLETHDKWLMVLPMFHVSGLSILLRSVIYGIPIYLMERYDKQHVHEAIMTKGITIASVVTKMVQDLVDYLGDNRYPDQFRCMLLGGGPAPKSLLEHAKAKDVPVFQSYGLTETASQIVTLGAEDALEKLGSSGKPLFPAQVTVDAPSGDIGEIFVKGPMVTHGYFHREHANDEAFSKGWFRTGDLGRFDQDGFLYVVDRRKDLIISGGENIYPTEIENVLVSMEGVTDAGVVGKKDDDWGQVPVAFIVAKQAYVTVEAILEFVSPRIARFKIPKEIHFLNQLPRNISNKLERHRLMDYLE